MELASGAVDEEASDQHESREVSNQLLDRIEEMEEEGSESAMTQAEVQCARQSASSKCEESVLSECEDDGVIQQATVIAQLIADKQGTESRRRQLYHRLYRHAIRGGATRV